MANRLCTLPTGTGQAGERLDCTDERLERLLRPWSDATRWVQCESSLNQHPVRVSDLSPERLHVDSTTASASASVSPEGVLPCGPRKDDRPALPHVKGMQAVLDPLGIPLATDGGSGERADDPLDVPCIERGQQSWGRSGLLLVGACTMAAPATRACIARAGAEY